MVSGLPLDRNCEHVQFSRYELVGRRGRKGHERCSCSNLIPRQAVLQQCRTRTRRYSCEENKLKVSPYYAANGDGGSGDEVTAEMKHTEGIYYAFVLLNHAIQAAVPFSPEPNEPKRCTR